MTGSGTRTEWRAIVTSKALAVFAALALSTLLTCTAHSSDLETVVVETDSGRHTFYAEIADTPQERERGLMFRQHLPQDRAMLFDWGHDRVASMWMRNTLISLDMIFIRRDGTVESIAHDTKPESLEVVSSQGSVAAVLEVIAGTSRRIGLKPGDVVRHRMFSQ